MEKKLFLLLLTCALIIINFTQFASAASHYIVCKSQYALCTTAKCATIAGKKNLVSCACNVRTGYSAGTKPCQEVKQTPEGQLIKSRYYPIKSYQVCTNNRPWAWCLDSPCYINKNDASKATCFCSVVKNQGSYILVTESYNPSLCDSGIYSSATLVGSKQLTNFLKTQPELLPFPIKVIKK